MGLISRVSSRTYRNMSEFAALYEGCRDPAVSDKFTFDIKGHLLPNESSLVPKEQRWSPYSWHGGSIVGIAGENFVVVASDTRLGEHGSIYQRDLERLVQITPKTVLGSCGFHGDALQMKKVIKTRCQIYEHNNRIPPSPPAIAQMVSTILYGRRFFPYYVYNIIAGMDDEGKGALFSYDPVGCVERVKCISEGTASSLLQPFLDNQIYGKNLGKTTGSKEFPAPELTKERAIMVIKDAFISAAERETNTGDSIVMQVVTNEGITKHTFPLRRD